MSFGPLIVQSDNTVLLETYHPQAGAAREALAVFAELERAPEHIHTYRITRLGLWNARAAGHDAEEILDTLNSYAKFPIPEAVKNSICDTVARYGKLEIVRDAEGALLIRSDRPDILREVVTDKKIAPLLLRERNESTYEVSDWARGELKQQLLKRGWPAADHAGYTPGDPHAVALVENDWQLRDYQRAAVSAFTRGGSGVVVLPCGAGKTLVGAGAIAEVSAKTLILVTNTVSARQWREELLRRTDLTPDDIGEYSGEVKEIKPVTIATYQILTAKRGGNYAHLSLLSVENWGLIIYDEVHLLPAPVFKLTAELQARRRLGLTATLVREDGREGDVFSLIGPKRFDVPWHELTAAGFIAPATCFEVRIDLDADTRMQYAAAEDRERYRIASTARQKIDIAREILAHHDGEQSLIIGQYIDQLEQIAEALDVPLITGQTPTSDREELFAAFRAGRVQTLVVSKVANFSIDLPEASVAIQISGSYGSRQEEAQRLGRILRPKSDGKQAHFYTLVTRDTVDQDFAQNRQRFLAEQGYAYELLTVQDLAAKYSADS
ncbi:DNA repair helicase XPB [Canibacter zhoujuaniae]|uniref:DNA repair helicase XPB n=1 Tax=Canibacter zhoujuaniae TaxID=2708343 RepID=UPI00141EB9E2|nr:DNA repair helicase XPB [Canibacter zhoujuaniae]